MTNDADALPRLLAVEVGVYAGLGHDVRLELAGARTVLVGKNGAGKSLLMEGIFRASRTQNYLLTQWASVPRYFRCDVDRPSGSPIAYEYRLSKEDPEEDLDEQDGDTPRPRIPSFYERCWDLATSSELWSLRDGRLTLAGKETFLFLPGLSLIGFNETRIDSPPEAELLHLILSGFAIVPAGVPRSEGSDRREILVPGVRSRARRWRRASGRVGVLASTIASFHEHSPDRYEEFVKILKGLGLVREVTFKVYEDPQQSLTPGARRDFASILFDGVNIGLLSDGTLRASEIIVDLLRPAGSGLLIEEPETAVHPGLLSRLLAIIDSYAVDRQIIVSTHSPIVVNWCEPAQLRLVERIDDETRVRGLSAEEVSRVESYLNDEGTFADYVYGRSDE